jgi:uncharacterized protein YutE (UPF0331/DUF86 family)
LVVDEEAIRSRLRRLDRCVRTLRALASLPEEAFLHDEAAQERVERNLHVASQSCIDIASHLVSEMGWGDPATYEESLVLAGRQLGLDARFLDAFRKIAGLRNLLVHDYLKIDPERLRAALVRLDDFATFAAAVLARFPAASP